MLFTQAHTLRSCTNKRSCHTTSSTELNAANYQSEQQWKIKCSNKISLRPNTNGDKLTAMLNDSISFGYIQFKQGFGLHNKTVSVLVL
jgi:hypothetical protein